MSKRIRYTKEEVENAVLKVISISALCRELNLTEGRPRTSLNKFLRDNNIDTTHFKGCSWNLGNKKIYKYGDTKLCNLCKEFKPINEFNFKDKARGLLQKECKKCNKIRYKKHYKDNRDYYLSREKAINPNLARTFNYLKSHPCVHCGESDPIVLEFDHIGPKTNCISKLIHNNGPWSKVMEEIEHCQVLCANCHTRKTAKDFDWYKYRAQNNLEL